MASGIGVDIETIKRFRKRNINKRFLDLIFTDREKNYCERKKNSCISYAGKFCAKEAVIKALGRKIPMLEIEIINDVNGKPEVYIRGKLNKKIKCSISHSEEHAVAFVVMDKNEK